MTECPHCHKDMGFLNHGVCDECKKHCGCSWDPTSMNDYCSFHRPGSKEKGSKAFHYANKIAEAVIAKKPSNELELWHAVTSELLLYKIEAR